MIDQSGIDILAVIGNDTELKKVGSTRGGEFKGACPKCGGADRFIVWPLEGKWTCRQCFPDLAPQDAIQYRRHVKGETMGEAVEALGLSQKYPNLSQKGNERRSIDLARIPDDGSKPDTIVSDFEPPSTRITLDSYATQHDIDPRAYRFAGVVEITYRGHPCLSFPVSSDPTGINRLKFLDFGTPENNQFKYMPASSLKTARQDADLPEGETKCWYGLDKAVLKARENQTALVLCNGLSSTIEGQWYGVPAFCWTDGETGGLPTYLQPALEKHLEAGMQLIIALDADVTGRDAANKTIDRLEKYGKQIQRVEFGGDDGYDLRDYCRQHKYQTMTKLVNLARNYDLLTPKIITSTAEAADEYSAALKGAAGIRGHILLIPFERWHPFGGLMRVVQPRKVIGIIGRSGDGKTSFVETLAEAWMKQGFDGFFFGKEWTPKEYQARRVQRVGGLTVEQMLLHEMALEEIALDIPKHLRSGVIQQTALSEQLNEKLVKDIPGQMHYFTRKGTLDITLEDMSERLFYLRREGRRPAFVIFDYIQIMQVICPDGRHKVDVGTDLIKDWTSDNDVVSIIVSQVRKDDSQRAAKKEELLEEEAGQWFTSHQCNLFMSLNHLRGHAFEQTGIGTGQPANTGLAVVNVTKNSLSNRAKIKMRFDFKRLQWVDQSWTADDCFRFGIQDPLLSV